MNNDFLGDRRFALEEAFFARENDVLRQRLRDLDAAKLKKEAFFAACGITDDTVIEMLESINIGSETLAALALVPLVMVAWADGTIDDQERATVLARAADKGLSKENVSYQLFEGWLAARPPSKLLAVWKEYTAALSSTLSDEARRNLKAEVMTHAREVAESAGGFLGIGRKVSASEENILIELDKAFGL